jgi:hypothetical protein
MESFIGSTTSTNCINFTQEASTSISHFPPVGDECISELSQMNFDIHLIAKAAELSDSNLPMTSASITWTTLVSWAEQAYPKIFGGPSKSGRYQDFDYVFYSETGNYIALRNGGMVYVLGPSFDNKLQQVGTLSSLETRVRAALVGTLDVELTKDQKVFLNWAEVKHPLLFNGSSQDANDGIYTYRFYSGTGNYLMFSGDRVYLRGSATSGATQDLGLLSAFVF